MPTWFKCKKCDSKYYTAAPLERTKLNDKCEKCQNKLEPIYYEIKKFLTEDLKVNINLHKKSPVRLNKASLTSINNKRINLTLTNNQVNNNLIDKKVPCIVNFAREEYPAGRFYFNSKVLNYDKDKRSNIVISTPEYLIRKQERSAPRYPLRTKVKFKLADSIKNLTAEDQVDYNNGWTIDISKTGLLFMADKEALKEINKDKYKSVKIMFDRYNISTFGNIVRVNPINKANNRIKLGIKFHQKDSVNLDFLDELSNKRMIN